MIKPNRANFQNEFRSLFLLLLVVCLSGCATPPNVEPFANATSELRRAIVEGGTVTAEAMTLAAKADSDPKKNKSAKEFVEIWQVRLKLADVLLGYSDAISGIASAGKDAEGTSKALGQSIMSLASYVPVTGLAIEEGVNLGQLLLTTGLQIKANKDLGKAIDDAHEALDKVAGYLQRDLVDLKRLYKKANQDLLAQLDDEYGPRKEYRELLLNKQNALRSRMKKDFTDSTTEQETKLAELLSITDSEHKEYLQKRKSLIKDQEITIQMFETAKQGVKAWINAHKELKLAIEQNRRPNVLLIMSTAEEIKEAVDRIRNQ